MPFCRTAGRKLKSVSTRGAKAERRETYYQTTETRPTPPPTSTFFTSSHSPHKLRSFCDARLSLVDGETPPAPRRQRGRRSHSTQLVSVFCVRQRRVGGPEPPTRHILMPEWPQHHIMYHHNTIRLLQWTSTTLMRQWTSTTLML